MRVWQRRAACLGRVESDPSSSSDPRRLLFETSAEVSDLPLAAFGHRARLVKRDIIVIDKSDDFL